MNTTYKFPRMDVKVFRIDDWSLNIPSVWIAQQGIDEVTGATPEEALHKLVDLLIAQGCILMVQQ